MERERKAHGISGGLFLITLGVIFLTGWWWPGIMVAIGVAVVGSLILKGEYGAAVAPAVIFFGIPALVVADMPWEYAGPIALIGSGALVLARVFYPTDQLQS